MNAPNRTIRVAIAPLSTASAPHQATPPPSSATVPQAIPPLIDIHEGPEGLVLEADLPGASPDSLTVQLEDNVLTLQAQGQPRQDSHLRMIHEEYRAGDYQRSFILSDDVDRDRISAELKNGVLRLTLPRMDRAKSRRIEIKSS